MYLIKKKLSFGIAVVMILASVTVLFSAGTVEAHSPSDVSIDYNIEEEELTVDITHSVGDPQSHYIYNVVVEVDGTEEINEEYDEQPDDTNFQYTYDLVAEPGSTIVATAYCNQGGSGSDTYEVEDIEDIVLEEFTVNEEEEDVELKFDEVVEIYASVTNNMEEETTMVVTVERDDEEVHSWEETVSADGGTGVIDETHDHETWDAGDFVVRLEVEDVERTIDVTVLEELVEEYQLTINIDGEGSVTVEWNDHTEVVEDSSTFDIAEDTEITLTAEADDGWEFVNWDIPEGHEDYVDEEDETITFPLHTDFSTTATFEEEEEDDGIPGFTSALLLLAVFIAIAVYYKKS